MLRPFCLLVGVSLALWASLSALAEPFDRNEPRDQAPPAIEQPAVDEKAKPAAPAAAAPADQPAEKPAAKPVDKPAKPKKGARPAAEKPADKESVAQPTNPGADKPAEAPADKPADKPAAAPKAELQPLKPYEPPKPDEAQLREARENVERLGDDKPHIRLQAGKRLTELGAVAHQPLLEGLKHRDAEIRRQCRWLLAAVLERDFQLRLDAFTKDTSDTRDYGIPGWRVYRQRVGNDPKSRELFVQMQKAEMGLFESLDAGGAAAAEAVVMRVTQIFANFNGNPRRNSAGLANCAALLFVAAGPDVELPGEITENYQMMNLLQQDYMQKALASGELKEPIRKIVGLWLLSPASINMFQARLNIAIQHQLPEGLDIAIAMIEQPKNAPGYYRGYAVSALGGLGGKSQVGRLAMLLDDKSEVQRGPFGNAKEMRTEVRDVALGWLVHLTGQNHSDYGMEPAKREFETLGKNARHHPNYGAMGFPDNGKRDAAHGKWKAWVAEHPLEKVEDRPQAKVKIIEPRFGGLRRGFAARAVKPPQKTTDEADPWPGMKLQVADRAQIQALLRARELCANKHYAEGIRLLDRVLAESQDYAFQPDLRVPLYRCLKPEAERILAELPDEGRNVYRLQFAAAARAALGEATEANDMAAVAAIVQRFFHTEAGAEACYLLGSHYANRSEPFRAAIYLARLKNESRDATRFEPALSVKLAACWAATGMTEDAQSALASLSGGTPRVQAGGKTHTLFTAADKALAWLGEITGRPVDAHWVEGWLMYRGGAQRNSSAQVGLPYLQGKPLAQTLPGQLREYTDKLVKQFQEKFRPALPPSQPLVVDQTVIVRSPTHLMALSFADGRLLWEAPLEDSLRSFLAAGKDPKSIQEERFLGGLRRRLWEDVTCGSLASDGQCVFAVEDVPFGFGVEYQQMTVSADGKRYIDAESIKRHNLLTAHDLRTGKLRWEIGGARGPGAPPLAGAYFLGAPLPLGTRLYVVANIDQETRLLELDASSGGVLNQLTLSLRDADDNSQLMPGMWIGGMPAQQAVPLPPAASPSYADGTLVCQIGAGQFAGISLASRTVRWVYQTPEREGTSRMAMMFNPFGRGRQVTDAEHSSRWTDSTVTVAEGCVLLTPPEVNELICLGLHDGRHLWSVPRGDGLYLGGVRDGRVIVVGRGGVRGLRLADGQSAWSTGSVALPAGALPSGAGLLSKDRYHVPLGSGEVLSIDLKTGRAAGRSRSPEGIKPGNLVACRGVVFSQNVEGLWRFDTLLDRDEQLAAESAKSQDDARWLLQRGEVALYDGRPGQALELLSRSVKAQADARAVQLLADALVEGLRQDYEKFLPYFEQHQDAVSKAERQADLLQAVAEGQMRSGRQAQSFSAWLKMLDLEKQLDRLDRVECARLVRRDRWISGRMAETWQAAQESQRAEIDKLIAARMVDEKLPSFIANFGFHPSAMEARLRAARQSISQKHWFVAEQLLRRVIEGGEPVQRHEAIARLAAVLREAGQVGEAAEVYRYLEASLGDTPCLDGRNGKQLAAALPDDDPVTAAMKSPIPWRVGQVRKEADQKAQNGTMRMGAAAHYAGGMFDFPRFFSLDMNQRRLHIADNLGAGRWAFTINEQPNNYVNHYYQQVCHAWVRGGRVITWTGNRIGAIDILGAEPRTLWHESASSTKMNPNMGGGVILPFRARMGMMGANQGLPASDPLPLVDGADQLCYLRDGMVVAVDPLTNVPIWRRDDVGYDCHLLGDDEVIFAAPNDGSDALVLSARDGAELGRRPLPPLGQRLRVRGRMIVTWKTAGDDHCELAMFDPWTQQCVWRLQFAPSAQPGMIGEDEAAVLDRTGKLVVLSIADGTQRFTTNLEPAATIDRVFGMRYGAQYTIMVGYPAANGNIGMFMPGVLTQVRFNGRVFGIDATGKRLWEAEAQDQSLGLEQPHGLPVLVLCNYTQTMENNQFRPKTKLLCIDKRNGKLLHAAEVREHRGQFLEINSDPKKGIVDIRSAVGTCKLTFTDQKE